MRILLCSHRDVLGNIALNHLLPALQDHELSVLLSHRRPGKSAPVPALAELDFFRQEFVDRLLYPLIERFPESGRGRLLTFNQLEARHRLRCQPVENINQPERMDAIRAFRPDLILSVHFALIFRDEVLAIPRLGTLNLHSGSLPEYRGLLPTFRAMMDGAEQAACTLHYVDRGLDTGPIVGTRALPLDPTRSMLWHLLTLYPAAVEMCTAAVQSLARGEALQPIRQESSRGKTYTLPTPDELTEFSRRGLRLVDIDEYLTWLQCYYLDPREA